jgi:hypothetical protein
MILSFHLFLIFTTVDCLAQSGDSLTLLLEGVDIDRIEDGKTKEKFQSYLKNLKTISERFDLDTDLNLSHSIQAKSYLLHEREFYLSAPISFVWKRYMDLDPREVFQGGFFDFHCMLSLKDGRLFYANSWNVPKPEQGNVYFFGMNFFGALSLSVGLQLKSINPDEYKIIFQYAPGLKTRGEQVIQLIWDQIKQATLVKHTSTYKGQSAIRDRLFYPFFHTIAIERMHQNINKGREIRMKRKAARKYGFRAKI